MINTTIAHYRITSKLGQGGMGEVYRATDTKLDRDVAIKILPESFAGDRNRVARFKREAKGLAAIVLVTGQWDHGTKAEHTGKVFLERSPIGPPWLMKRQQYSNQYLCPH